MVLNLEKLQQKLLLINLGNYKCKNNLINFFIFFL